MDVSRRGFIGGLAALMAGAKAIVATKPVDPPAVETPKAAPVVEESPYSIPYFANEYGGFDTLDVEMIAEADFEAGDIVQAYFSEGGSEMTRVRKPDPRKITSGIMALALHRARRGERMRCRVRGVFQGKVFNGLEMRSF